MPGLESVDRPTIDAARAQGFTEWQVLSKVEIPLALPLLVGGFRSAALQVIATATVAAYVGLGGLGRYLIDGQAYRDYPQMVGGSVLVIALALVADGALRRRPTSQHPEGEIMRLRHITLALARGPQRGRVRRRPDEAGARSPGDSKAITIGSAAFPENEIIAEIYAQALEAKGIAVRKQLNIGAREVYIPALEERRDRPHPRVHRKPADVPGSQGDRLGTRRGDVRLGQGGSERR